MQYRSREGNEALRGKGLQGLETGLESGLTILSIGLDMLRMSQGF